MTGAGEEPAGDEGSTGRLRDRTFPVVLAGPSGSGKTTVGRALERKGQVRFSVSATTRPPRPDEEDGVDYRFLTEEEFQALVDSDELLEWAEVHGHRYGTPRDGLREARRDDVHLLLDIDVQGARSVQERVEDVVTIFLLPPDGARIVRRLVDRGSEGEGELRRRLRAAEAELEAVGEFDYVVVNDRLEETVEAVAGLIRGEESRTQRMGGRVEQVTSSLVAEIREAVDAGLGG